ncbi:GNAT family N-acetyltransferase [Rothia aerolata]|uniref:N-acetyltransferase n=1 Tax=Rothia aerolata TaxID=1812262 RepID=A0A917ING4_9MICC|nr:GNAT family N-acetyltransferase [Rothia aerolata]GGH57058.1 N-acetyltransferase [Rothia aerolata]
MTIERQAAAGAAELEWASEGEWENDAAPRSVTITHLQMLTPPTRRPLETPANVRIERVGHPTPELARWLYSVVGGPYRWYERLGWSRQQWQVELEETGSEIWLIYLDGTPAGYCQLHVTVAANEGSMSSETEILYFGLMQFAQGQGLGKAFLEAMIANAWSIDRRHPLPAVSRVWVHTCDLDGPFALANYQKRGLEIMKSETHTEVILKHPLSSWESMFAS